MNLFEAKQILELSDNYELPELKSNYRRLVKKYHPDKNPDGNSMFLKVQEAYEYLIKEPELPFKNPDDIIGDILKSFNFNLFRRSNLLIRDLKITPLEYYTGVSKEIKILNDCNCPQKMCRSCYGTSCEECIGNGFIKNCNCPKHRTINIKIPKLPDLTVKINNFKLVLSDERYRLIKGKMTYLFDISLKESLIGFTKTFEDPFYKVHEVIIKNTIIKQNDGYSIILQNGETLVLMFNVIYPEKLSKSIKKTLSELNF